MTRIAGIDLPKQKRGVIGLTYIFGIGRSSAKVILAEAKIDESKKVQDWDDDDLSKNKWVKIFSNKYFLIVLLFSIWMFFFDTNSYFIHNELNKSIETLENNKEIYKDEIKDDKAFIDKMKDSNEVEKYAREKYYLKKENEDIYIIEHQDSIKNKVENE